MMKNAFGFVLLDGKRAVRPLEKADKIIDMLGEMNVKLDGHSEILADHSEILADHSKKHDSHTAMLQKHSEILADHSKKHDSHTTMLQEHTKILTDHSKKHDNHTATLQEHGQILSALRTGQDHLKAEQEGMEIASAGEMSALREHMDKFMIHFDMLRDESWKNRADIQRLKNTLGMD